MISLLVAVAILWVIWRKQINNLILLVNKVPNNIMFAVYEFSLRPVQCYIHVYAYKWRKTILPVVIKLSTVCLLEKVLFIYPRANQDYTTLVIFLHFSFNSSFNSLSVSISPHPPKKSGADFQTLLVNIFTALQILMDMTKCTKYQLKCTIGTWLPAKCDIYQGFHAFAANQIFCVSPNCSVSITMKFCVCTDCCFWSTSIEIGWLGSELHKTLFLWDLD